MHRRGHSLQPGLTADDASRLGLAVGLACSRSIEAEDPDYQRRIDEYVAHHCSMHVECGTIAIGNTYDQCFEDVSTQSWWWDGDDCPPNMGEG